MPYFHELYRIITQNTDYTLGKIPIDWKNQDETKELTEQAVVFMQTMETKQGVNASAVHKVYDTVWQRIKDSRRFRDHPDDPQRPPPAMRDFAAVLSALHGRIQALEAGARPA